MGGDEVEGRLNEMFHKLLRGRVPLKIMPDHPPVKASRLP